MQNLFSSFHINLSRMDNNKIIVTIENLKINFYINLDNIINIVKQFYQNIQIEFVNFNERKNNKDVGK